MTKAIRCDRCGRLEDRDITAYSMGYSSFYIGRVSEYRLGETAGIHSLDLCKRCQPVLDKVVTKFMDGLKEKRKKNA